MNRINSSETDRRWKEKKVENLVLDVPSTSTTGFHVRDLYLKLGLTIRTRKRFLNFSTSNPKRVRRTTLSVDNVPVYLSMSTSEAIQSVHV